MAKTLLSRTAIPRIGGRFQTIFYHRPRRPDWRFTFIGKGADLNGETAILHNDNESQEAHRLTRAHVGDCLHIVAIASSRSTQNQLQQMGLRGGAYVQVVSRQSTGPVILAVGDRHVRLSASISQQVIVSRKQD